MGRDHMTPCIVQFHRMRALSPDIFFQIAATWLVGFAEQTCMVQTALLMAVAWLATCCSFKYHATQGGCRELPCLQSALKRWQHLSGLEGWSQQLLFIIADLTDHM